PRGQGGRVARDRQRGREDPAHHRLDRGAEDDLVRAQSRDGGGGGRGAGRGPGQARSQSVVWQDGALQDGGVSASRRGCGRHDPAAGRGGVTVHAVRGGGIGRSPIDGGHHRLRRAASALLFLLILGGVTSPARAVSPPGVSYRIDCRLDPARHRLTGWATLRYRSGADSSLPALYFHSYPNAFRDNHTVYAREGERYAGDYGLRFSSKEDRGWMG